MQNAHVGLSSQHFYTCLPIYLSVNAGVYGYFDKLDSAIQYESHVYIMHAVNAKLGIRLSFNLANVYVRVHKTFKRFIKCLRAIW